MTAEVLKDLGRLLIELRSVRRRIYQIAEKELEQSGNSWEYFQLIQIEENVLKGIRYVGILVYPGKNANENTIDETNNGHK